MISKPEKIPFTSEGYQKLEADQDRLNIERAAVLIRLQTAREMGDLSENGAYKAARFELGTIDRELRRLKYLLHVGYIDSKENSLRESVVFGSYVTLSLNNKEVKYRLVNQYESDPGKAKLSVDSPIGSALMGQSVGDTVEVKTPSGPVSYQIKAITSN